MDSVITLLNNQDLQVKKKLENMIRRYFHIIKSDFLVVFILKVIVLDRKS